MTDPEDPLAVLDFYLARADPTYVPPGQKPPRRALPSVPVDPDDLVDGLLASPHRLLAIRDLAAGELLDLECSMEELLVLRTVSRCHDIGRAPPSSDLAGTLKLDRGYISRLTRGLVAAGYLTVTRHPRNKQSRSFDLTPRGEKTADVTELAEAVWRTLVARLGEEGAADVARGLVRLRRVPMRY